MEGVPERSFRSGLLTSEVTPPVLRSPLRGEGTAFLCGI